MQAQFAELVVSERTKHTEPAKFRLWIAVFVCVDAAVVGAAGVLTRTAFTGGMELFAVCAALA